MFVDLNTIHNPSTGTAAPASWGDAARDDLQALYGPPRVRVHKSASQGVGSGGYTTVLFDTEDIDTHAMHSTVSNTERLTVPANWGGDYAVGGTVMWQPSAAGTFRNVELLINGVILIVADVVASSSTYVIQNFSTLWFPVAGDYFSLQVSQDTGSSLNVDSSGYAGTIFWAKFLGNGAG